MKRRKIYVSQINGAYDDLTVGDIIIPQQKRTEVKYTTVITITKQSSINEPTPKRSK